MNATDNDSSPSVTDTATEAGAAAPNIVLIQADQLVATALGAYGNTVVQSPEIDALAADGIVFERAYCNSPLCAPSRASMMTGLLPSQLGAFDNAAPFSSTVPTFAHYLRVAGYHTALVGRMHFIGPDQLHGFEQRATTDVYPAGMDMIPDWRLDRHERLAWYHDTDSVFAAEPSTATVQLDYDEEVIFRAIRHLNDRVRTGGDTPFLLVTSFIHPHDPYEPPLEQWHRYDGVEIDPPRVAGRSDAATDPHSQRLLEMCGFDQRQPNPDEVLNARRAYYASVSYIDDHVGRLVRHLEKLGLRESTVVIVTSDHGDMLGEHGLWYKMSPFESSVRVPLIVNAPSRFAPTRIEQPVSLLDLAPTLVELGNAHATDLSGRSLVSLIGGQPAPEADVLIEYLAEGVRAPLVTIVRGTHKLVRCPGDPDQMFDLATDPDELSDLLEQPTTETQAVYASLSATLDARYDLAALEQAVRISQERRRVVQSALARGEASDWDYEPNPSNSYVRGDFWTAIETGRIRTNPSSR